MLELLIDARKRAQLSQAQLAVRLRKPQSFVSKYERGERRLDVIELLHVCHEVGTDIHEMIRRLEALGREI
ncbi:TPA: helix-turn-helix transcriptional regulator [Pseudomonas aeruginosa]|nr:helix-turn-helix transcriptional regulator [Pseudomonas aeruginosa]